MLWFEWIVASSRCADRPSTVPSPWTKICRNICAGPLGTLASPRPTHDYTSTRLQYCWWATSPEKGLRRALKFGHQFYLLWSFQLGQAVCLTSLWCRQLSTGSAAAVCTAFLFRILCNLLLKWVVVGRSEIAPLFLRQPQEKITGIRKVPLK